MPLLILLILLLSGCASKTTYGGCEAPPKLASIHIIDREGMTEAISNPDRLSGYVQVDFLKPQPYQKVLRVYSRDPAGNVRACITTYHANGELKQYLDVLNNRAYGSYREWHVNGALKVEGTVVEGVGDISLAAEKSWVFDGDTIAYDDRCHMLAKIPYCRGGLEGTAVYYHKNGNVWKEIPYAGNLITGESRLFLETGELFQSTCYCNGLKDGASIRFWPEGTIAAQEEYQRGLLITGAYFDREGCQVGKIANGDGTRVLFSKTCVNELQEYRHGLQEGRVESYDDAGTLISFHHIKNGLKQGEEIRFYPKRLNNKEPIQKISITWFQGKVQGLVKTWYENGVLENQREMSENKKNGVSSSWYRDGQLMMIEEYERGSLTKGDYFRKGERKPISHIFQGEGTATLFDSEGNYLRKVEYHLGKPN